MKPPITDTVDHYAVALATGDSYAAQLAALLYGYAQPSEAAEESGPIVEEPDF